MRLLGPDESGLFEKFVYARNDDPEAPMYCRPSGYPRRQGQVLEGAKRIHWMHNGLHAGQDCSRMVFPPRRYLPQQQELKTLVDSMVVVGSAS